VINFRPRVPESDVLFEVSWAREHGAGDDPVDVDGSSSDVLKYALVGGWFSAFVVIFGEAVDGDGDAQAGDFHPVGRDGDDAAGHDHGEDFHCAEHGKNAVELAMADHGLASDQGDVHWAMAAYEIEDALDEGIAAEVSELAQRGLAAEMIVAVRVTAGTGEWTLARDLDGEQGSVPGQDSPPGAGDVTGGKTGRGDCCGHIDR
jgi:hypothetical protein